MRLPSLSKTITHRGILTATSLLAGSLLLSSCLNDLESPEPPPAAHVSIFHGSPSAPAMDIFANQNRVNQNPIEYSQVLPYTAFYPGVREFRFSAINSATALLEKDLELKADSIYSVFVSDKSEGIDAIFVKDIWDEPSEDKAQLRLVHLSGDTESVYLEVSGSTTPLVTESTFKSVSDFEELNKGSYTLTVKSTETDETLIQSGTLELKGNRIYTLILRGLSGENSGDKKLDLQLITNYIHY